MKSLDIVHGAVRRAGQSSVGVLLDAYHLQRGGRSGAGFRDLPDSDIYYVQFSDVPDAPPNGPPPVDRLPAGKGLVDWSGLFRLLAEKNYRGFLSYEAPNPAHWNKPAAETAREVGADRIVNAIAAHHEQVEPICPESVLVAAAEALSAARPGARREALESYVKRLEKLESLAPGHKGVQKAYAIQAGREIRVIVRQEDMTDTESFQLSRELAKKIEQELTYPGQIKVTVIRESRFVEYAK